MNKIKPSLNLLKPEMAFALKWLSPDELARLEQRVLNLSYSQCQLLKHGWGIGDGTEG